MTIISIGTSEAMASDHTNRELTLNNRQSGCQDPLQRVPLTLVKADWERGPILLQYVNFDPLGPPGRGAVDDT